MEGRRPVEGKESSDARPGLRAGLGVSLKRGHGRCRARYGDLAAGIRLDEVGIKVPPSGLCVAGWVWVLG